VKHTSIAYQHFSIGSCRLALLGQLIEQFRITLRSIRATVADGLVAFGSGKRLICMDGRDIDDALDDRFRRRSFSNAKCAGPPKPDAAAPGHVCPGIRIHAIDMSSRLRCITAEPRASLLAMQHL
jgi:hypothetical protein